MQKNPLVKAMEAQGLHSARDYVKRFNRPGAGTIERYMAGNQDPITSTGTWRTAPSKIAEALNVPIGELFPEASERRQQVLDEISMRASMEGIHMTLLQCVRCPKTAEGGDRATFVMVDLTCAACQYKEELTPNNLVCNHPGAKQL